jgi:hypothetical protein
VDILFLSSVSPEIKEGPEAKNPADPAGQNSSTCPK